MKAVKLNMHRNSLLNQGTMAVDIGAITTVHEEVAWVEMLYIKKSVETEWSKGVQWETNDVLFNEIMDACWNLVFVNVLYIVFEEGAWIVMENCSSGMAWKCWMK